MTDHWAEVVPRHSGGCIAPVPPLQMGGIPVYLWDDCPWLPYTKVLDWSAIALLFDARNVSLLPQALKTVGTEQQEAMRRRILELRDRYFTLEVCVTGFEDRAGRVMRGVPVGTWILM